MIAKEYSDILFNNLRDTLINTKLKEFSNETILVQNVVLKTSVYNQNIEPYCNLKQSQIVIAVDPIRMYFEFNYTKVGTEETKTYSDGSQENVEAPAFYDLRFIKNAPDGSCIINIEQINKNEVEKIMAEESVLTNVANGPYRYY